MWSLQPTLLKEFVALVRTEQARRAAGLSKKDSELAYDYSCRRKSYNQHAVQRQFGQLGRTLLAGYPGDLQNAHDELAHCGVRAAFS